MVQGSPEIVFDQTITSKKNGWYLYVWGAVFYNDGFGNDRTTRFCHRYNCQNIGYITMSPGNIVMGYKIEGNFARYNRYGNDAD